MADAEQIKAFLTNAGWKSDKMVPLAGDASARRYLRSHSGDTSAIVMVDPTGNIPAFRRIAGHLGDMGLLPPHILAADPSKGLMLMEDLGDAVFSDVINTDPSQEIRLYLAAIDALIHLRRQPVPQGLPRYGPGEMAQAIAPAFDWYLREPADHTGAADLFEQALRRLSPATDTLVLRDFHAQNLIWQDPDVRLLDFQDAVAGHNVYDLVSLLQDARRSVSLDCVRTAYAHYLAHTRDDPLEFAAACAIQAAQRNLRILGIFARLARQNGKTQYVDLIPRVWSYLMDNLSHPDLTRLSKHLTDLLPEPDTAHLNWIRSCAPTP